MNDIFNKKISTISVQKAVEWIKTFNGKSVDDTFEIVCLNVNEIIKELAKDLSELEKEPIDKNEHNISIVENGHLVYLRTYDSLRIYKGLIGAMKSFKIKGIYEFNLNF